MKKTLIILTMAILALSLSGCARYGKGETVGYVYAVDDGILWDEVWYKSSVDSSESDCYLLKEDSNLKEKLRELLGKTKVKIYYEHHLFTLGNCPEGTATKNEIIGFEVIE